MELDLHSFMYLHAVVLEHRDTFTSIFPDQCHYDSSLSETLPAVFIVSSMKCVISVYVVAVSLRSMVSAAEIIVEWRKSRRKLRFF
jgi:hypothetical protein